MDRSIFIVKENTASSSIWVRFYIGKERLTWSTNIKVLPEHFDTISGRVLSKDRKYKDKNLILSNIESRVDDIFVKFRLNDRPLTKDLFLKAYNRPSDYNDFFLYFEKYMRKTRITIEDSTAGVHRSVMKKLKAYKPDLAFGDISHEFLSCYFHYLRKKLGLSESSAYKNIGIIKKYVRAALREGFMDIDPFAEFKVKKVKSTSFTYLTEEEIAALLRLYHSGELDPRRQAVLRFFLWMCFSSQHVTDARNTNIEDVREGCLHYYRVKLRNTKPELLRIPVSRPLAALYEEARGGRTSGRLFTDIPSDQKINRRLKEIARMAGIDKPITCKTGRHTFATYFLAKTQQITTLQNLLGHSNISETMIYAHVLDESKVRGMACFDGLAGEGEG